MKMKRFVVMAGIVAIIAVGAGCASEQVKETVESRETTESQETVEDTKLAEFADEAVDYIVNELTQFGVTRDEMDAYFERNKGDEFFNEENFCCMVLNNKLFMMDGQKTESDSRLSYYMGFYADGYFDAANMSTGNYIGFTKN